MRNALANFVGAGPDADRWLGERDSERAVGLGPDFLMPVCAKWTSVIGQTMTIQRPLNSQRTIH
jgi:hypothetical protein